MQHGTLHLLHSSGVEDDFQPLVHLAHPVDGGYQQCIQECDHCGHVLAGPGNGGGLPVHVLVLHGLACLQRCFTSHPISLSCLRDCPFIGGAVSMQCGPSLEVILRSTSSSLWMSRQLLREGCCCSGLLQSDRCSLKRQGLLWRWCSSKGGSEYHRIAHPRERRAGVLPLT
jgi:hypothetical protein